MDQDNSHERYRGGVGSTSLKYQLYVPTYSPRYSYRVRGTEFEVKLSEDRSLAKLQRVELDGLLGSLPSEDDFGLRALELSQRIELQGRNPYRLIEESFIWSGFLFEHTDLERFSLHLLKCMVILGGGAILDELEDDGKLELIDPLLWWALLSASNWETTKRVYRTMPADLLEEYLSIYYSEGRNQSTRPPGHVLPELASREDRWGEVFRLECSAKDYML